MAFEAPKGAQYVGDDPGRPKVAKRLECGGKRSATPLWLGQRLAFPEVPATGRRRRRFALPAHSKRGAERLDRTRYWLMLVPE